MSDDALDADPSADSALSDDGPSGDDPPSKKRLRSVVAGAGKGAVRVGVGAVRTTFSGTKAFTRGTTCVARGLVHLVRHPKMWPWAIAPVICAFVVFVGTWVWLFSWLLPEVEQAATMVMGEWLGGAAWLLSLLAVAAAGLIAFYAAFPAIVRVVAAPFLALLADRVFEDISGLPAPMPPGGRFVRWVIRPILEALALLGLRVVVTLLALSLLCIPVAGTFLFFLVLLPVEGMDLLDLAMSARAVPIRERYRCLLRNLPATSGLGLGAAAVLLVPVVNVFLLPALVVGAILLDRDVSPDFPLAPDRMDPARTERDRGDLAPESPDGAAS